MSKLHKKSRKESNNRRGLQRRNKRKKDTENKHVRTRRAHHHKHQRPSIARFPTPPAQEWYSRKADELSVGPPHDGFDRDWFGWARFGTAWANQHGTGFQHHSHHKKKTSRLHGQKQQQAGAHRHAKLVFREQWEVFRESNLKK